VAHPVVAVNRNNKQNDIFNIFTETIRKFNTMRQRCETCKYFKYVDSNVYGRCQKNTEGSVLEGIPRVPWATVCEFFQDRRILDKNDLNEEYKMEQSITQKRAKADDNVTIHCAVASKTDRTKP